MQNFNVNAGGTMYQPLHFKTKIFLRLGFSPLTKPVNQNTIKFFKKTTYNDCNVNDT